MKLGKIKESLFVFFLFSVFSLLIFFPIFLGKVNLNGNLLTSFYPIFGENLPYKNIVGLDQLRLYFPNYSLIIESFRNLGLPLWNPYIFAGTLNIASLQSAVFYPLNIFSLILAQAEFWHLLRISPLVLGSFFTYIYLRNLKLSQLAAFFGAMSFGFGPFLMTWGEEQVITPHTIIWLPLLLYCVDKILTKRVGRQKFFDRLYFPLISVSVAFSVFAGFIQTTIYLVIFVLAYLLFKVIFLKNGNVKQALLCFLAILLGIIISAIQIFPTAELYFNSARATVNVQAIMRDFLLPVDSLLTYFAPDFFGNPATWNFFRGGIATYYESIMFVGVGVLLFAIYEIFENKKDKLARFYWIFSLLAIALTLDLPTSRLFLKIPIPFLSSSIVNRLLFIPAFSFTVLAAKGIDLWRESKELKINKYIFLIGAVYLLVLIYLFGVKTLNLQYVHSVAFGTVETYKITLRNLILPIGVFGTISLFILLSGLLKFNNKKNFVIFLIIVISAIHLFLFSQKYLSFSQKRNVFPKTAEIDFIQKNQGFFRSWGLGEAFLENNFASKYKIYWPEGYNSLNILSYAEFTQAMQGGSLENFTMRADAGLGRGRGQLLLNSANRRKLIDMVGVRYVIGESADFDLLGANNFVMVFDGGVNLRSKHFAVFENKQVQPRAFLASNYEGPPNVVTFNKTEEEIKKERRGLIPQKLLSDGFDWRNVIILEEPSPISPQFGEGKAEIVSYKDSEVLVKTESDQPKLLFLSDNYYPGWKVKIDGAEGKILRANYTFRAVPLVAGKHVVRFYFESDSFRIGLVLSAIGLGLLVLFILRKNPLID